VDTLHFEIGKREDPAAGLVDAVGIFINGSSLVDMVREVELPFAASEGKPRLAGKYVGLPLEAILFPSRRLLGDREERYDDWGGRISVLGCGCDEVGCWPLQVVIAATENRVTWSDFEQPHRKSWRHDRLGPFVFERGAYERALRGEPEG
jgi:hypothetical protein